MLSRVWNAHYWKAPLVYLLLSRYCGKAVCEECSHARRQLSIIDKNKYRVCDECDGNLIASKVRTAFDKLVHEKQFELKQKANKLNELKIHLDELNTRLAKMEEKVC